jgi:hypothetical protein
MTAEEYLNQHCKPEDWNNLEECLKDSILTNNVIEHMERYAALRQNDVSGSISLTANVPKQFAEAVKELHKGYNIELKEYKEYKNNWTTVVVQGSRDNLEKLNRECEQIAYRDVL